MDGGIIALPSTAYKPFLEKQYVVIAVRSNLFDRVLVTASGGQGILEKYEQNGVVYLRNLDGDIAIEKIGDKTSQVEPDISLENFLKKVGELNQ